MFKPQTVLVVDDDPIVHAITEQYFSDIGVATLIGANDGAEAIVKIDELGNEIDLILLDLNMPEVDGLQFLRHLMEVRFSNPVIIISGEGDSIVRIAQSLGHTHRLNIAGSLGKPLRPSALTPIIQSASKVEPVADFRQSPDVGVQDLRAALNLGEIEAYFQPKFDADTGQLNGAEALARWHHPRFGMIGPDIFVPIAEQNLLLLPLTTVILEQSLAMANRCWSKLHRAISIAINTNSETLINLEFPRIVKEQTEAAGVPPSQITFEVTERSLFDDSSIPTEVLTRLRMMGFGLSIDDFGTGKSNLEQLRLLPFSELKIDQSFVRNAQSDSTAAACLRSIVQLGSDLDLKIVAEGIETERELELCRKFPIHEYQGFYFSKPLAPDDFLAFVAKKTNHTAVYAEAG